MVAMPEDLDARLRRLRTSDDAGALIDLGCDLADVGRHSDAEWCFRRATGLGEETDVHRRVKAVLIYLSGTPARS